jgi:hypothetical protein
MANKAATPTPEPEKPKDPEPFPATDTGIDENGLRWEDVTILGTPYRFREITVPEADAAYDASQNPDKTFNARLNQRMELVACIVSPKVGLDDIEGWGVRKLRAMLYVADRLNTLSPADTEGNA